MHTLKVFNHNLTRQLKIKTHAEKAYQCWIFHNVVLFFCVVIILRRSINLHWFNILLQVNKYL